MRILIRQNLTPLTRGIAVAICGQYLRSRGLILDEPFFMGIGSLRGAFLTVKNVFKK